MKDLLFSVNSWIFGQASIEEICSKAKELTVDGIDISGEPDTTDLVKVKSALQKYDLIPFCINGNFTDEHRCMSHNEASMRSTAIEYGKKLVDMAANLGAKNVLIVPSQVNRQTYFLDRTTDYSHAVESIREIALYAQQVGDITIIIECVNKYECALIWSLQDGIQMAKDTQCDNVRIIADTFHMQLEETDGIPASLRKAGNHWVRHLHLGDNTREVPGMGCMNWREILLALDDISFDGALSFEPLPNHLSGDEIFAGKLPVDELVNELKFSLKYLRTTMQGIRSKP